MLSVFAETIKLKGQLEELSLKMAEEDPSSEQYLRIIEQYQNLNHRFELMSGYTYESEINNILNRFKFNEIGFDQKSLKLKWRTKNQDWLLPNSFFKNPDVLILDEPTNHLDIDTIEWLEGYLKNYSGAVVIVSHDRYFIDQIATTVYEIEYRKCTKYKGKLLRLYRSKGSFLCIPHEAIRKTTKMRFPKNWKTSFSRNIVRASTTKRAQSRRKHIR